MAEPRHHVGELLPGYLTATSAALVFGERSALFVAAIAARWGHGNVAIGAGLVASALFFLVAAAQHELRSVLELRLVRAFADATLRGGVLGGSDEELQRTFFEGLDAVQSSYGMARPSLIGDGAALLIGGSLLFATQPIVTLAIPGVGLALGVASVVVLRRATGPSQDALFAANHRTYRELLALIAGRLSIAGAGAAGRRLSLLGQLATHGRKMGRRAAVGTALAGRLPLALVAGAVLGFEAWRGRSPADIGLLAAVIVSAGGLASAAAAQTRSRAGLALLEKTLAHGVIQKEGGPSPPSMPSLRFSAVSARYAHTERDAIHQIDLEIAGPSVVAIAGPNGSGKSTVLRLLVGLLEPFSGDIEVGGERLASLDLDGWRRAIGFLPQRPFLPSGATVGESMTFLDDLSVPDVERALRRSGAWEVLRSKNPTDPLAVLVDELSGGERQRVAIARVVARKAPIYLFDEPEASLDREGLSHAARLLRELSNEAIVLVAAHGEELLGSADRVIRLENGAVVTDEAPRSSAALRAQ